MRRYLGLIACFCATLASTAFYDENMNCIFWYYDDDESPNPCGYEDQWVPENAKVIITESHDVQ